MNERYEARGAGVSASVFGMGEGDDRIVEDHRDKSEEVPADEAKTRTSLAGRSNSDAYGVSTVGGIDTEPARIVRLGTGMSGRVVVSCLSCWVCVVDQYPSHSVFVARGLSVSLSRLPRTAAWMSTPGGADLKSEASYWSV